MLTRSRLLASLMSALMGLFVIGVPGDVNAATVRRPTLDSLLIGSGFVFEGEVVTVAPGDGHTDDPRTRVAMTVVEVLTGAVAEPGDRFVFEIPEGPLPDGRFVLLMGAPRLAPGQRYLVFYRDGPWHHTPFLGWQHGVLRRVHADTGAVFVDAAGRCVVELVRSGIGVGPAVAAVAPSPPGWPAIGASDGSRASTAEGVCMPAEAVVDALRGRVVELGAKGSKRVDRAPSAGGWREASLLP